MKATHLPPGCGADLDKVLLFNTYQQNFQVARRMRYCTVCNTIGTMTEDGRFTCAKCGTVHTNNLTAPRVYDRFLLLSGRQGGKTLIGAHAAREEMMIPNSKGWVMGPTYKILHDSTFPTLVRLIPPDWVQKWDADNMEILFKNGATVAFRSLEDPERARGPQGVSWGWLDEAAQCPERAYDVFEPTLIAANGILISTTTVLGFDWTYEKLEKRAKVYNEPGYWFTSWWTEENPFFKRHPAMMRQIERARRTMSPEFFAQEYRAERRNATGLIYDFMTIERQTLKTDDAIREHIPEWPKINRDRQILVGLDSGVDHPFGAVLIVVTPTGLVFVNEYLERGKALTQSFKAIYEKFGLDRFTNVKYAANKNEANLRLELGLLSISVIPAESKHEIGIERVKSWLMNGQAWFAEKYVPKTIAQFQAYRYAINVKSDGQKQDKEKVWKLADELPDGARYAVMAWPSLPDPDMPKRSKKEQARWDSMDDKSRYDLDRLMAFNKREKGGQDLQPMQEGYPTGDFFQSMWE